MKPSQFDSAIGRIYQRNQSIDPQAYFFLKEALDIALKNAEKAKDSSEGHVSAKQLLHAFRDHALEEYGPMAGTLMEEWGLHSTSDVGSMVFALIEERMFGKQDSDSEEDFADLYSFHEAFAAPFLPQAALSR